jgi:hypothetical protein
MLIRHAAALIAIVASFAFPFSVQAQSLPADTSSIAIPESRLGLVGMKGLRGSQSFVVPTVLLYLSSEGVARVAAQSTRIARQVTGEYRVFGLRESFAESLAARIQASLTDPLASPGPKPILYDSVKSFESVRQIPRMRPDTLFGAPISKTNSPRTTFVIVAPTDAQLFAGAEMKKHLAFRNFARESGATVLVPELWFQTPQSKRLLGTPDQVTASMQMDPGMDLYRASITFITATGATGSITLMNAIEAADAVGDLMLTGADTALFSNSMSRYLGFPYAGGPNSSAFMTNRLNFMISEEHYSMAVMRGAMSFLEAAFAVVDRERRRAP